MASVLASYTCISTDKLLHHQKVRRNLWFSKTKYVKFNRGVSNIGRECNCRMQEAEFLRKYGTNGRANKMVPVHEINKQSGEKAVNVSYPNSKLASSVNRQNLLSKELLPRDDDNVLRIDEGFSWANEGYNSFQRGIDVWSFALSLRLRVQFDDSKFTYIGGFTNDKQEKRRKQTAVWLKKRVLQLGPTFIKLGQLLSTRSDLFPKQFIEELVKLQDRVPAFSPGKAKSFIQNELGSPIHILFKEFEDLPIAAASLGQVHRAVLHNGQKVAVKVQRPGLRKLFDIDLKNLKLIAEYFQSNETLHGPTKDWIAIYEECAKILYQEIDYVNEGKNAERFRRDFRNVKWVRIPIVYWDYTSTKVLTSEYVPGIKINQLHMIDAWGYNRAKISSRSVEAYLIQILKTGYFHADPHPGNLAIDVDESLIYYDFGMMGEIKNFTREKLLQLFYAAYEKDVKKVMHILIDLGVLENTGDMSSVRRTIKYSVDNLLNKRSDQHKTLSAIGDDLFTIATDQSFRFPVSLVFLLKAFSTLEGIGYSLDPNFSFAKIAAPYVQELLNTRQQQQTGQNVVEELTKQADDARLSTISVPSRIKNIEEIVNQLETGDLKLRVRVLESERAARKATILQMGTIYAVMGGSLFNIGVSLSSQGTEIIASQAASFIGAGIFVVLVMRSMQRVKSLDEIDKMM